MSKNYRGYPNIRTVSLRKISSADNAKETVPLKAIDVSIKIVGTVAEVESSLSYNNEEDDPIEAVFTFPVDDGSAVYRFEAEIDGRTLVAEIQEKEQAKLTYEDSVKEGKTAALLQQDEKSADIFKCSLGNLPARCEAKLLLAYVIELQQEPNGHLRFALPTILNPRYSPKAQSEVAADGATYAQSGDIPYKFSMNASVHGYHKVKSVTSDACQLNVQFEDDDKVAKVTLAEEFQFDHDLCLLVLYEDCFTPQVVMEIGNAEKDGLFKEDMLMLSFRPNLKEVSMAKSGEFIFVIDRSGSMNGQKIADAKEALLLFLKSLPPDCYFNVVSFGSSYQLLFKSGSKKYTEDSLKEALTLQEKMASDMGGTEILQPLQQVFKQKTIQGHNRNIFVLTDGQVSNTNQVIGLVKKNAASVRSFSLGIGYGASTALVNGIARAGNGRAEFIADGSRVQPKVISLLQCAMQPACTQVEIAWDLPPGITPMLIPAELPLIVTAGERLTLYARMQGVDMNTIYGVSSVTLKGQMDGKPVNYTMTFNLADDSKSFSTTSPAHRLAAKTQIKILEDEESALLNTLQQDYFRGDAEEQVSDIRMKVISLSRHANIISKMTSFVVIDKEGTIVEGKMVKRPCPVPTLSQDYMQGFCREQLMSCGLADSASMCSSASFAPLAVTPQEIRHLATPVIPAHPPFQKQTGGGGGPQHNLKSYGLSMGSFSNSPKAKKSGGIFGSLFCAGKRKKSASKKRQKMSSAPPSGTRILASNFNADTEDMDDNEAEEEGLLCTSEEPVIVIDDESGKSTEEAIVLDDNSEAMEVETKHSKMDDKSLMSVIRGQKLKGNWELTQHMADLLKVSMDQIRSAVSLKDDSTVCTLVVVAWLRKFFPKSKDEWQLIDTKAVVWLESQDLEGEPVSDLLHTCTTNLWP